MSDTPVAPGAAHATQVSSGSYLYAAYAADAGANGSSAVVGDAYDRLATAPALALSCLVVAGFNATMASGVTGTVGVTMEHSDDGSSFESYDVDLADATITALDSGAAQSGAIGIPVDLAGAKRYIRATLTPAASGTFTFGPALFVFGGYDQLPV
jgi:hypothetical protein